MNASVATACVFNSVRFEIWQDAADLGMHAGHGHKGAQTLPKAFNKSKKNCSELLVGRGCNVQHVLKIDALLGMAPLVCAFLAITTPAFVSICGQHSR
jgi:hypothetical protein